MSSINSRYKLTKDNKRILIRTAISKDAKELLYFMYNISKERIYSMVEPEEFKETLKSNRARIKKYKEAKGKLYIVAEHKNRIIGLVQFDNFNLKKSAHNGYLTIFIKKNWREKGVGRILTHELIEWSKSNSLIEKVSLSVFSNNIRAINLYRKMGFKQEGRCRKDMKINGEYVDSILMYKYVS